MELLLNGEASSEAPSADFLFHWFGEDHDPSEFLILRDASLGELRATAPQAGVCLLQTEGTERSRPFNGEIELSPGEAARLFVQFLSGDPGFREAFSSDSFSWAGWLVGVLVIAAAWWGWSAL